MKHAYLEGCGCEACGWEGERRRARAGRDRVVAEVMLDWLGAKNKRRARLAREWWDAYENGRPMVDDDR